MDKNMLIILGVAILFIVVLLGCWIWRSCGSCNKEGIELPKKGAPSKEASVPSKKNGTLVLLWGTNCPHCHNMMSDWNEAKQNLQDMIHVVDMNEQNPNMQKLSQGLRGVPTIRYYPDGITQPENFIEYNGNRSAESIEQFARENM